jgi:hypothetical protein
MSDDLLGSAIGSEEEKHESEASSATVGAEAFAAVLAGHLAASHPGVARRTEEFLEKQSRLLDIQFRQIEAQHHLELQHLRGRSVEGRLRRAGMRLRLAFHVLLAIAASAIVIALAMALRDAVTS